MLNCECLVSAGDIGIAGLTPLLNGSAPANMLRIRPQSPNIRTQTVMETSGNEVRPSAALTPAYLPDPSPYSNDVSGAQGALPVVEGATTFFRSPCEFRRDGALHGPAPAEVSYSLTRS